MAGAEPFSAHPADAERAALVLHGFTGSPASVRPVADRLLEQGVAVEVPRLPGHGTRWTEMNLTRWPDWYVAAERALHGLAQRYRSVVVVGLSMGGTLALRLAQCHAPDVSGLVLINPAVASTNPLLPAVPLLRHVKASVAGISNDIARPGQDEIAYDRTPLQALYSQTRLWKLVRSELSLVTAPILLIRSRHDRVVDASSARIIAAGVSSPVEQVELPRSRHVATLDHDAAEVLDRTSRFVDQLEVRA